MKTPSTQDTSSHPFRVYEKADILSTIGKLLCGDADVINKRNRTYYSGEIRSETSKKGNKHEHASFSASSHLHDTVWYIMHLIMKTVCKGTDHVLYPTPPANEKSFCRSPVRRKSLITIATERHMDPIESALQVLFAELIRVQVCNPLYNHMYITPVFL